MRSSTKSSIVALFSAMALLGTGAANAGTVVITGMQPGDPTNGNCGTGLHSTFLSGSVAEINFDHLLNTETSTPCGNNPNDPGAPLNFGVGPATFGTALGTVGLTGQGELVAGTNSGMAAQPWADNTPYLSVPGPDFPVPGSATLDLSNVSVPVNYFGVYWGSVDTANAVIFTLSDGSQVAITGADLPGAAAGLSFNGANQFQIGTNVFVDFATTGGLTITSVNFYDSQARDFELDNVAFGDTSVPVPGALALLGFGLAGLGAIRRKAKAA